MGIIMNRTRKGKGARNELTLAGDTSKDRIQSTEYGVYVYVCMCVCVCMLYYNIICDYSACYNRHSFKVTRALLLQLYNHTLEVRLWNTKEKVAPRARFDRPRAFRLPVEGTQDGRPDKFLIVGHDSERSPCRSERRRKRISKKGSSLTSMSEGDSDLDRSISISKLYNYIHD